MCSIFGYQGKKYTGDDLKPFLERTVSRGPDMERIEEFDGGMLGFLRLSIMGLTESGMQPFNLRATSLSATAKSTASDPLRRNLKKNTPS